MKKLLIVLIAFVLCVVPCVSFADFWACFTTYGVADNLSIVPDGEFSITLYMMTDLRAYIIITTYDGAQISTSTYYAKTKTKTNDPGTFYFVFSDDTYMTGRYGDDLQNSFLLDIDSSRSIRLDYVDEYNPYFALKER